MTMTKKRTIKTKAERELASAIDFDGKYVDSLFAKAAKKLGIEDQSKFPTAPSYLAEMKRQRAERIRAKWNISVPKYDRLRCKATEILRWFRTGYSMGEHKTLVIDEVPFQYVDNCLHYSKSCKYAPTHGSIKIRLSMRELQSIELVEGVWTVRGKGNACRWLAESGTKKGYEVNLVDGFLIGLSHGHSISECEALERIKNEEHNEEVQSLNRFVGLSDRVTIGACEPGVLAFCERHGLNPQMGYRLEYLMSLGDATAQPYLDRLSRVVKRRG